MMDRVAAPIETADGATVTIEKRGTAGIVTLARPEKRNALNSSMCRALASAYPQFAGDPTIYAVIVRSAVAGVFSSGADLAEVATLCDGDRDVARAAVGEAMQLCWRAGVFHEADRFSHGRCGGGQRLRDRPARHTQGGRGRIRLCLSGNRHRPYSSGRRLPRFGSFAGIDRILSGPDGKPDPARRCFSSRSRHALSAGRPLRSGRDASRRR